MAFVSHAYVTATNSQFVYQRPGLIGLQAAFTAFPAESGKSHLGLVGAVCAPGFGIGHWALGTLMLDPCLSFSESRVVVVFGV